MSGGGAPAGQRTEAPVRDLAAELLGLAPERERCYRHGAHHAAELAAAAAWAWALDAGVPAAEIAARLAAWADAVGEWREAFARGLPEGAGDLQDVRGPVTEARTLADGGPSRTAGRAGSRDETPGEGR